MRATALTFDERGMTSSIIMSAGLGYYKDDPLAARLSAVAAQKQQAAAAEAAAAQAAQEQAVRNAAAEAAAAAGRAPPGGPPPPGPSRMSRLQQVQAQQAARHRSQAAARGQRDEFDPMDPSSYSDAPRVGFCPFRRPFFGFPPPCLPPHFPKCTHVSPQILHSPWRKHGRDRAM